jgi:ABC-type transport system substrate-binding protein
VASFLADGSVFEHRFTPFPVGARRTALLAVLAGACRSPQSPSPATTGAANLASKPGARSRLLRASSRAASAAASRDNATALVTELTQARLVRVNKVTDEVERGWPSAGTARLTAAATLALRHGIVFSDGQPFTADDVVFTFAAIYDRKTGSLPG